MKHKRDSPLRLLCASPQRSPQPFEPARGFGPLSATESPKKKIPIHQITLEGPSGSKPSHGRGRATRPVEYFEYFELEN